MAAVPAYLPGGAAVAMPAQDDRTKPDGVAWWRRGMAVLAALTAVAAAVWLSAVSGAGVEWLYWLWVGVALAPLVAPGARAFRRWCLGAGLAILLAGALLWLFRLQAFAPSGVVLLCAALAGRRPLRWPLGVVALLVGVAALVWWTQALVYVFGAPPNVFVVKFDEQGYLDAYGVLHPLEFDPAPFDHGATGGQRRPCRVGGRLPGGSLPAGAGVAGGLPAWPAGSDQRPAVQHASGVRMI
jgi:hypothetical protein